MSATMTAADVLREARRLIQEKGWARMAWAKDKKKRHVHYMSGKASCFCATGALYRVTRGEIVLRFQAEEFLRRAIRLKTTCLAEWNDERGRTKTQVLRAFARAIALAEKQP